VLEALPTQRLHDFDGCVAGGLSGLYEGAHVFASASKHEGFCVPVIEALAAGCRVVATDAGALADTVGPCGSVVPLGDRSALSDALANAVEESRRSEPSEMPTGCRAHLSRFGAAGFKDRLAAAVEDRIRNRTGGVVVS
jgi:glycosyltransferase involved in cell wall biosynthesis